MRTLLIAGILASLTLTACSLYFSDKPNDLYKPDASLSSDAGHWYPDAAILPDAAIDAPNPTGCDAGTPVPDAYWPQPDAGPCCNPPPPDAAILPDAPY